MHVLTVLCHPSPSSFTHAIAQRFGEGARSAGHTVEVADLYAEGFDPILIERDLQQFAGWGYRSEIEHLWRYGILGYCGVDPIRIELLTDCGFDSGAHGAHLDLAYEAGRVIERDPLARPGIREMLCAP